MNESFTITMERTEGFDFHVRFDPKWPALLMDEPEPLGKDHAPNASRLLGAAIGNCLSASLLFCLQKSRVDARSVRSTVTVTLGRNEKNRLRITGSAVEIRVDVADADRLRMGRCLELFEDFCVVTQSVRQGIPVSVTVADADGKPLSAG